MNPTTFSQSRPTHRLSLHKLTGTPSVSKWCRNVVSRWTQRVQHGEQDKGVDIDVGNKSLAKILSNEGGDVVEDEWDERAMLDIAEVVAEVVEELDVYRGAWKEWNEADIIIDSAKFDDASFYSDDSASWDSDDNEDGAPNVDEEEKVRLFWCSDDSTSDEDQDEVVKVSDKSECGESEYWDSFVDDASSGEVFIPSVVEEVNIFEGLFDDFNDSNVVIDSPEVVDGSFYSYHSSSWDSSWESEDGAAAGDYKSYDLDWLYPVVEQIYDLYLEI